MNGEHPWWINPESGVVHHFLCTQTKGAYLVPWAPADQRDGDRSCRLCLPLGLAALALRTENP